MIYTHEALAEARAAADATTNDQDWAAVFHQELGLTIQDPRQEATP